MSDPYIPLQAPDGASEGLCMLCDQTYATWFAPSELWNKVMRAEDGTEALPFVCPTCFALQAERSGIIPTAWVLSMEEPAEHERNHFSDTTSIASLPQSRPSQNNTGAPMNDVELEIALLLQDYGHEYEISQTPAESWKYALEKATAIQALFTQEKANLKAALEAELPERALLEPEADQEDWDIAERRNKMIDLFEEAIAAVFNKRGV